MRNYAKHFKWKNKTQAKNRAKILLDNYIEGYELLNRELVIDHENDSEIIEFSEEDVEKGEGYLDFCCLEASHKEKSLHLSSFTLAYLADLMDLDLFIIDDNYIASDNKYKVGFNYKDFTFFCLWDYYEYTQFKDYLADKEQNNGE